MASYFPIVQENVMVFLHIWSPCQKSSGDFDIATTSLDIYWSIIPPHKKINKNTQHYKRGSLGK